MIADQIHDITQALPAGVRLVAVSKYHPAEAIREAYAAGQRLFGESHAQELQRKHQELAFDWLVTRGDSSKARIYVFENKQWTP